MRRSVREALVGFSVLAAIAGAGGMWLWLRGISLGRNTWTIRASFSDAAGLADRSPVSFRGVLVGNVRRIQVTDQAVLADLQITDPKLRLSRPVVAQVGSGSLLGGDAVVSLLSSGQPLPQGSPRPGDPDCDDRRMVCDGGVVRGVAAASLDTVTETVQKLLDEADRQKLVPAMVDATRGFERTAKEAENLSRAGRRFLGDARGLVGSVQNKVDRVDPILRNIDAATADAAAASRDVRALTGRLDTPATAADLRATVANARRLTRNWSAVGENVNRLTADPDVQDGVRSLVVGLGSFFEELYPARVDAARQRDRRRRGADGEAGGPAGGEAGPGEEAEASGDSAAAGPPQRLPLPPPPPKRRSLSAADQRELDRVRAGAGYGFRRR